MANIIDQLFNKEYKRRNKTNTKGERTTTCHNKGPKYNPNQLKDNTPKKPNLFPTQQNTQANGANRGYQSKNQPPSHQQKQQVMHKTNLSCLTLLRGTSNATWDISNLIHFYSNPVA
jgi:hypothetical protein